MINDMKYELTQIENNRIGVTITNEDKVVGILYFEKAKLNFTNKPLSMGSWACVDAKIEDQEITEAPQVNLEEKMESLPETLRKVETLEELKSFKKLVYSKSVSHEIQAIYEEKLRQLKGRDHGANDG